MVAEVRLVDGEVLPGQGAPGAVGSRGRGVREEPYPRENPASPTVRAERSPQVWQAAWKAQSSQCNPGEAVSGPPRQLLSAQHPGTRWSSRSRGSQPLRPPFSFHSRAFPGWRRDRGCAEFSTHFSLLSPGAHLHER